MKLDLYVKATLTVIAASLVALVLQNASPPARAQRIECGTSPSTPCYVTTRSGDTLDVIVKTPIDVRLR